MNNDIIDYLLDPEISQILIELENTKQELSYLAKKLNIKTNELEKKLEPLLKNEIVISQKQNDKIIYEIHHDKLSKIIEHDENFNPIINGLTRIDSYLN